jgi:F-type H+-transporting ATPase subunit b
MSNRRTKRSATRASRLALATLPVAAALFAAPAHAAGDLVLIPEPPLALTLGLLFVALIYPLNVLIFKPIFAALDERSGRIAGAHERAAHIQNESQSALSRYEESIREARTSAEAGRKEQLTDARGEQASISNQARAEAERQVERARGELERSLEEARGTLRTEAQQLARVAAEQILGRNLS